MKAVERRSRALRGLLHLAGTSPITITYRGVDGKDRKLYEVTSRSGSVLCNLATEEVLVSGLSSAYQPQPEGT